MATAPPPPLELRDVKDSYETMLMEYNKESNSIERKRKLYKILVQLVNELNKRWKQAYSLPTKPEGGRRRTCAKKGKGRSRTQSRRH